MVVTYADHPIRTLGDLIDMARSRPAPLLFGSAGNGSLQHLAGELLAKTVSATFQHVPYRGSAQAITDLLARRIDFIVDSPDGRARIHPRRQVAGAGGDECRRASSGCPRCRPRRRPAFPDTPSPPGRDWWRRPASRSAVINRLNAEIAAILAEPATIERIRLVGNDPSPSSPEAFKARIAADIDKWTKVVDAAKIERI